MKIKVPVAEAPVCIFQGQSCSQACLWSVKVENDPFPCILAVPIDEPVADWYKYTPQTSRTDVTEGLLGDYINVRITNTTFDNSFYYCSIFSSGAEPNDGTGLSRSVSSEITAGYNLGWQVEDDPSDIYSTNNSRTLTSFHEFRSDKSDGFCVGPINYRLGSVSINYFDLKNINGLHFQAWNPDTLSIETLDKFDIQRNVDTSIGPVSLVPNCFADCLASIGLL